MKTENEAAKFEAQTPQQRHRRQAAWQVWLPFALLVILFVVSAVFAAAASMGFIPQPGLPDQQSDLAKSAAILILSGMCAAGLLPLLLLFGSVILTDKAIKGVPVVTNKLQRAFKTTAILTEYGGEKLVQPLITLSARKAAARQLIKSLQFWKQGHNNDNSHPNGV